MHIARLVGGIGRVMMTAGVVLLLFVVYQLWGTGLQTAQEQDRIEGEFAALQESVPFAIKTTAAQHYRRVLLQGKKRGEEPVARDGIARATRPVGDGQGIAFVSHRGDVFPSGFLPIPCGNVREEGIAEIYREHPLFVGLRDPDRLEGKCGVCEFRKVCGGSRARAFAMLGDVYAEDPACAYLPTRAPVPA